MATLLTNEEILAALTGKTEFKKLTVKGIRNICIHAAAVLLLWEKIW